jgi:hypothetical protein
MEIVQVQLGKIEAKRNEHEGDIEGHSLVTRAEAGKKEDFQDFS